ncbi:MAG: protoporphyrinogen oxidase [Paludisphaera borealis]|uniref:protoporphyrinogen oxidase n=1 Tax=Paludisphaera borealis TaxID=1387353 RepID=UPI002840DD54|nr:protoporphyrinogen oxidase [Paludisphaera borealis]MDR3620888.1 protoporphyrinogen oxidase [Paludisphaera borealis]
MKTSLERSSGSKTTDRVVVIGGGLSGLVAAHRIHESAKQLRRPVEVVVLEAKDRVGGVIRTDRRDGFTLEGGPDSFITNKPWALDLCRRLNLEDQLIETDSAHRRSFVVRNGRLAPVPEGFVLMAPHRLLPILTTPILSWRGKLRLLAEIMIPRRDSDAEESLASFVRRRFGREALERLVQPLVGGIYTGDPGNLSLKATLPQFLSMEKQHGSLIRAAWRQRGSAETRPREKESSGARYGMFVSLADGMDVLPRTLAASLGDGAIQTGRPVRRISRRGDRAGWVVELLNGPPIEADAVIATTEAHATARMLDGLDPSLALQLRAIPYASSIIVNVAYRRDQVKHPLDGFGVVVPAVESRSILAASFLNVKFPSRAPAGSALIRVFIGGATQPDLFDLDDDAIREIVARELGDLIGVRDEPLFLEIGRHPRAMPQYVLGHLERVEAIRRKAAKHPNLFLTGIAFDGVGIPDCVHAAETTADAVVAALAGSGSIAAA